MATVLGITIEVDFDARGLREANKKIGKFLKTGLKGAGVVAGVALGAVGAAAAVAAAEAINFAEESNAAMEQFRRTTGLAEGNVEQFGKSAKNLFAAGFGEDIDDIAGTLAEISNTMQTGAKETEGLAKQALVMRDVFDKDVSGSIDSAKVLMDEFGLTSDQAFDFMTKGIQSGLDKNDDFLESISEYSNLFSDAGFGADEFFSIMETGAAAGVLGTDKISDAVKEFGIKMVDASDDTFEAFTSIGLDFDQISADISSGNASLADTFGDVVQSINEIESPIEKARVQAAIFGTAAEDLGVNFTEGLSIASTSLDDMSGSMDNVIDKNTNLGESMGNLKRQMVVALEPAAQELMPLLGEGINRISEFLTAARPIFTDWAGDLSNTLGPALESVSESLVRIGVAFGLIPENVDPAGSSLDTLVSILDGVNAGITGVAEAVEFLAGAIEKAVPLWEKIQEISGFSSELTDVAAAPFEIKEGSVASFIKDTGLFGRKGSLNVLGLAGGGVIPGPSSRGVPIIAHGGEEIANPNEGQAIVIGGEQFAAREAGRLANAINAMRQQDMQELVNTVAANL